MIENLKRIREPLAWAVVALVVANLVLGMVELVHQLQQAVPLFDAFQAIGNSLLNISLVIALVALVCTCFFITPATRHARQLTLVAACVLTIGVALTLVSYVLGAAAADDPVGRAFEIVGGLLDLALKALAAGALWVLLRGVNAGRIDTAPPAPAIENASTTVADEETETVATPPTTWQRSEAAGTVWRTADEAAAGEPGAARMPRDLGAIFRDQAGPTATSVASPPTGSAPDDSADGA